MGNMFSSLLPSTPELNLKFDWTGQEHLPSRQSFWTSQRISLLTKCSLIRIRLSVKFHQIVLNKFQRILTHFEN